MEISVQQQQTQSWIGCPSLFTKFRNTDCDSLICTSTNWRTPLPLFHSLSKSKLSTNIKVGIVKYEKRQKHQIFTTAKSSCQLSVYGKRIGASFISVKGLRGFLPRSKFFKEKISKIKAMSSTEIFDEEPNTHSRGTITIPIEFQSHSTQTDKIEDEEEDSDDVEDEIKHLYTKPSQCYREARVRDQCTSPIPNQQDFPSSGGATGYSKTYFDNLEKLTGHIIIHKFITRNEEEFQHLIQISFPNLKSHQQTPGSGIEESVSGGMPSPSQTPLSDETMLNKSVSMTLIPLLEENDDEENKNNDLQEQPNSSLSNYKDEEQMNNEDHHNILTSKEPTFLTKMSNELEEKEGRGRLPCQNDIGLNEFRISLDTLLEEEKEEVREAEDEDEEKSNSGGSDSNNDDNESTVAVGDTIITSMSTNTKFLEGRNRKLLACDSNESTIPCECFSFPTSDNNTFNISIEAEIGTITTKTTVETVDDSDDEDSSSIIHSVNYFGEKDDGESETESIASSVNEDGKDVELGFPSKNIATQTDEKSFCKYFKKLKSVNLSANSNATTTTSESSGSMSLLDVELHVEKLDLRVRVGGGGRKQRKKHLNNDEEKSLVVGIRRNDKNMTMSRRQLHLLKPIDEKPGASTTKNVNEDELDFLEVKGRRILL